MTNWFSYEWELQGLPAKIHVDMQYAPEPEKLTGHTTLIYITCISSRNSFTPLEKMHLDKVLERCKKVLGPTALYVGFIDLPAQRRYYFYVTDARILVPLCEACSKNSLLRVECYKSEEPDYKTYYYFLFPDDAKYQGCNNIIYINQMKKHGDNLQAARRVNLTICFPALGTKSPFLKEAKDLGFALGDIECNEMYELPFSITLHAISSLDKTLITRLTTKAIYAAQKYAGVFCRLDSEFVPKNLFR